MFQHIQLATALLSLVACGTAVTISLPSAVPIPSGIAASLSTVAVLPTATITVQNKVLAPDGFSREYV